MGRHRKNQLQDSGVDNILINVHGTHKLDQKWFKILQATHVQESPIIIGIDEAARGSVFGPMIVAGSANLLGWFLPGIKDSKLIRQIKARKALADEIRHNTIWVSAVIPASVINRFGTVVPLKEAGRRVAAELVKRIRVHRPYTPLQVIFDGRDHKEQNVDGVHYVSIEKADATIFEVSCASIIAKSTHDGLIEEFLKNPLYRRYEIESHRGYGTSKHKAALEVFGLSDQHRTTACDTFLRNKNAPPYDPAPAREQPAAPRPQLAIPAEVFVTA